MIKRIIYILITLVSFFIVSINVKAIEYKTVTKREFSYEINSFYISGDYLIINGWAIMDENIQNYYNDSTHSYSLVLKNNNDVDDKLIYDATLLPVDKTNLFKYVSTHRACGSNQINQNPTSCYMTLQNVGFEFKIPLSDLKKDTTYTAVLRMYSKTVNRAYQTIIYAPNIRDYQVKDGVKYELYSDFSTTKIIMLAEVLFVKDGPSTSSSRSTGWQYCSSAGYVLYWKPWEIYTSLQETARTTNGVDSETWFRVMYDQGLCQNGKSRAIMGWSYSGWMPSTYTDFDGDPAIIKITSMNYSEIDQIKTYTSPNNTQTKANISLYNKINQTVNIKLYHRNDLVYDQNMTFNGKKELSIPFINKGGEVKIVVTETSGYKTTLNTTIYTSSYENYESSNSNITVNPTTPIIVIATKTSTKKIYERIKVSIPYNYIKLVSGKPIQTWSYIEYSTDNNELSLNKDIKGTVIFPSQESSLNYPINNNKVVVNMVKTDSNFSQAIIDLPEYVLDKNKGYVYEKGKQPNNITTIYGNRKWYTPINDSLGKYNYEINDYNLGVNRISIKFNCNYETYKKLFGNDNSYYILKRTYKPDNLLYRFHKSYNYQELLKLGGK